MSVFSSLTKSFVQDLAIDLGTANTLVCTQKHGIVIREPSVVAVKRISQAEMRILAVGQVAKEMMGRTPRGVETIRPLKDGVISDFDIAQEMLSYFIRETQQQFSALKSKPRIVIAIPSGITQVERRAVREAALLAGSKEVFLIEEPMAAAIGAGLPVQDATGSLIVDIGGGTTEVAVISLASIVFSDSSRVGGDVMDETITQYAKQKYNLLIGERTAENVKILLGNAINGSAAHQTMEVRGRDVISGVPKTLLFHESEIRECLADNCAAIVKLVKKALEQTPPELAADIVEKGIFLAGGGSMLPGLDKLLSEDVNLKVMHADDPLSCVALGTLKVLAELDLLAQIELNN